MTELSSGLIYSENTMVMRKKNYKLQSQKGRTRLVLLSLCFFKYTTKNPSTTRVTAPTRPSATAVYNLILAALALISSSWIMSVDSLLISYGEKVDSTGFSNLGILDKISSIVELT